MTIGAVTLVAACAGATAACGNDVLEAERDDSTVTATGWGGSMAGGMEEPWGGGGVGGSGGDARGGAGGAAQGGAGGAASGGSHAGGASLGGGFAGGMEEPYGGSDPD